MDPSPLLQFMNNNGVTLATLSALFLLPLVATVVVLARQIIGLKGFHIFTPLITAFAFHEAGLGYGLLVFAAVMVASLIARAAIKGVRLQYLPRMALVVTVATFAVFLLYFSAAFFSWSGFAQTSLLPVLVLIALAEQFVAAQIEQGKKVAFVLTFETLLAAIAGYGLLSWPWLAAAVLHFPGLYLIVIVLLNVLLGRWTGLRLLELWRFRAIIADEESQ